MSSTLVWKFGLMGAVIANFLIKPVQAFFLYIESRKVFTYKLNMWKLIYLPLVAIVSGFMLFVFIPDKTGIIPGCIQFGITAILIYFTYRKELLQIFLPFIKLKAKQV